MNNMLQQELREICEVLVWLDNARWEHISRKGDFINYPKYCKKDLPASKKILTHWICYITDRQMPFEQIWEKGGVVFSDLVDYYMENSNESTEDILHKYYGKREQYKEGFGFKENELKTKKGEDRYVFVQNRTAIWEEKIYFAPRFPRVDKECVARTLKNLESFDRNFIKFLIKKVNENNEHDDILVRIACELYFLTYADKPAKKAFEKFNTNKTTNKKRVWAALRDYIKPGSPYRGYLLNGVKELLEKKEITKEEADFFREKWNNLPLLNQLELPGDRWNKDIRFNEKLLGVYINEINTKNDGIHISKDIRKFYDNNKEDLKKIDFYPERLDVTFDFVPRMCDKKECNICPFGKEGSNKVCHENDNKLCSVSLVTCGYAIDCKPNECIIQKGVGKNTCTI